MMTDANSSTHLPGWAFGWSRAVFLAVIMLLAGTAPAGTALAGMDQPAVIVPVDTPITVDGDDQEWRGIQAQQTIFQGGKPVAQFKLAADKTAFYAYAHVRDTSPLLNNTKILQEVIKGGDAIGFCFLYGKKADRHQRIVAAKVEGRDVVMVMRPRWNEKEARPYTYKSVGSFTMDDVGELSDAKVAFAKTDDGYVCEIAIPWKVFGRSQPAPGSIFPFDMQVIFSDEAGLANESTAWWHSQGNGSLATMDLVTEVQLYPGEWGVARAYQRDPGTMPQAQRAETASGKGGIPVSFSLPRPATVSMVIKDERGWVVNEPIRAERLQAGTHTITWNGRDRRGELLSAGCYQTLLGYWDSLEAKFVGSVGNSGVPCVRSPDGLGSVGGTHGGPVSVAADASGVYIGHAGEEGQKTLRKIDPDTGAGVWFAGMGVFGAARSLASDGKDLFVVNARHDKEHALMKLDPATGASRPYGVGFGKRVMCDLALTDTAVWVMEDQTGILLGYSRDKGEQVGEYTVENLRGIATRDNQSLYLATKNAIHTISLADGTVTGLMEGFEELKSIAVDGSGILHLAEGGSSQQMLRVDAKAKRILSRAGCKGGRAPTVIPYNPADFRNVEDIAIDAKGCVWVVEPAVAPRRVGRFASDSTWISDNYGPTGYGLVGVDLDDPATVYYQHSQKSPCVVEARMDLDAYAKRPGDPRGTWKVVAIHELSGSDLAPGQSNPYFDDKGSPARSNYGRIQVFTAKNGHRYLFVAEGKWRGLWRWDKRWIPAAAIGDKNNESWFDGNGDGLVQDEERSADKLPGGQWSWIDRDCVLYGLDGSLAPASFTACGTPVYGGGAFTPALAEGQPKLDFYLDLLTYGKKPFPDLQTGGQFVVANFGLGAGRGFWDRADETRLTKIEDGKVAWMIGNHTGVLRNSGDNVMLMNLTGVSDGVVVCAEVESNFTAYTTDGLTLGWVSRDGLGRPAGNGLLGWYVENVQQGLFFKEPNSGRHLLVGTTTEDVRVLEVSGVFGDDITRVTGEIELPGTPPPPDSLPPGQIGIPNETWARAANRHLAVDGIDLEWTKTVPRLQISDGKSPVAEIRMRRDAGALCIFADVTDLDWTSFRAAKGTPPEKLAAAGVGLRLELSSTKANEEPVTTALAVVAREQEPPAVLIRRSKPATIEKTTDLGCIGLNKEVRPAAGDGPWTVGDAWTACPGVQVALRERYDRQGYKLEIEIPLAVFPELVTATDMHVVRNQFSGSMNRLDLTRSFPLKVAVIPSAHRGAQVLSWDGPHESMAESPWAAVNAFVQIRWQAGAEAFDCLRTTTASFTDPVVVGKDIEGFTTSDLPGDEPAFYWLRPKWAGIAGQLVGPISPSKGEAAFDTYEYAPPVAIDSLSRIAACPGMTSTLTVVGQGEELTSSDAWCTVTDLGGSTSGDGRHSWQLALTPEAAVPSTLVLHLKNKSRSSTVELQTVALPFAFHGPRAQAYAHPRAADQNGIGDAAKVGEPSCTLVTQGAGSLLRSSVGRRGHVIPTAGDWAQRMSPHLPEVEWDAFTGLNHGKIRVYPLSAKLWPHERPAPYMAIKGQAVGSQGTIVIRPKTDEPLLVTVLTNRRSNMASPCRWTVAAVDAGNDGPVWDVVQWDGGQGAGIFQLPISGPVRLTCTLTGEPVPDIYNRPGVAALFFDPLKE